MCLCQANDAQLKGKTFINMLFVKVYQLQDMICTHKPFTNKDAFMHAHFRENIEQCIELDYELSLCACTLDSSGIMVRKLS